MGSCISKCNCQKTTFVSREKKQDSTITSSSKSAITQKATISEDKPILKPPKTPPPDPSSSLSSSFSPSCTTASTANSLSSNSFVSNCKQKIPPQIVILDPMKPQVQSNLDVSRRTPVCKRARSRSPSLTRQKSLKTTVPRSCSPSSQLRKSPSPSRRVMTHCNLEKKPQISSSSRPLRSRRESGSFRVGKREMEIRKHPVHPLVEAAEGRSCRKTPVMEDLANPLIDMDCFIFI